MVDIKLYLFVFQSSLTRNQAPTTDLPPPRRSRHGEAPKTTTLSLLKSKRKPQRSVGVFGVTSAASALYLPWRLIDHSAAAQIAAMEAKLAMMQQRKPADEDYVPGQSFATTSSAGPSRSVSPGAESPASGAAEGSVEPELADAELAADDLMREVWAEMQSKGPEREETQGVGSGQVSVSHTTNKAHAQGILLTTLNSSTPPQNLERTRTASLGPASTATTTTSAPTSSSAGLPKPMISSLPPRPSPAVTEMAMRDRDRDAASISGGKQPERGGSQAQSDAIKRGLASLPKKPTF